MRKLLFTTLVGLSLLAPNAHAGTGEIIDPRMSVLEKSVACVLVNDADVEVYCGGVLAFAVDLAAGTDSRSQQQERVKAFTVALQVLLKEGYRPISDNGGNDIANLNLVTFIKK